MSKTDPHSYYHRGKWLDCEFLEVPVRGRTEPSVLVRRRPSILAGPRGDNLAYLPGEPVISLFTGAGGFDIGLEQAGFCTVCQHEWDADACGTLMVNRPGYFRHAALIQGDIRLTPTTMLLQEAGLRVGEPYMVVGGPPCQGFSRSNTKTAQAAYDERNDLVFEYLRVVRESQPHFFIFENVEGFMRFNKSAYLKLFLERAFESNYELVYGMVNAVEYGVPQNRPRFICMGTRKDLHAIDSLLASLPEPRCFGGSELRLIQTIQAAPLFAEEFAALTRPPGIRYFPDRDVLVPPDPANSTLGLRSKAFHDFYAKVEASEPDRLVHPRRLSA